MCATLVVLAGCRDPRRADSDDPRIRYEGRISADARGRVRLVWPGTAMHLRVTSGTVSARLTDTPFEDSFRDCDRVGVSVDGAPLRIVPLREGTHRYALTDALPAGLHTVRVVKLTEGEVGAVRIDGVSVEGGSLTRATPRPARTLLAIGDSITAGYGVDAPDPRCEYDVTANNADRAWVSLAARALGDELHLVAWSGRGVWRNYDPAITETLPTLFERAVPTEPDSREDLTRLAPDAVVLNVGTNDAARPGFDRARFEAALDAFVRRLEGVYPRARYVLAVGPMLNDNAPVTGSMLRTQVRDATVAVARRSAARGVRVQVLELPMATPDEGWGCGYHPSAATQARMAARLVEMLRARW